MAMTKEDIIEKYLPPNWQRTTPRKNDPVRAQWYADVDRCYELYSAHEALVRAAREAGYGTKKQAVLEKQEAKALDAYLECRNRVAVTEVPRKHAHAEDLIETGDAAQTLVALGKLGFISEHAAYELVKIQARRAIVKMLPDATVEDTEAIVLDAATMLSSYPAANTLQEQVEISIRVHTNNKIRSAALKLLTEDQVIPERYKDRLRRQAAYLEPASYPNWEAEFKEEQQRWQKAQDQELAAKRQEVAAAHEMLWVDAANTYYKRIDTCDNNKTVVFKREDAAKPCNALSMQFEFFAHRSDGGWSITEAFTGRRLAQGRTLNEAKKNAKALLADQNCIEKLRTIINEVVLNPAIATPRYRAQRGLTE